MTYIQSKSRTDREYSKFDNDITGSATMINMALFALSGANWLPVRCLSDGTLLTSGA